MSNPAETKRLNKWISETGICSRREADKWIAEGRVEVNGQVAEMGVQVSDADEIKVGGKPLRAKPAPVYLAYNKPVGVTCTTERSIRSNIVDAVDYPQRIFPIGRLDRPSEGLILLTNDGDIVNKILRAGNEHDKEYVVTLARRFDDQFLQQMRQGVPILDTVTQPCRAERISGSTFKIVLTQGLNRQIRRMTEYLGHEVVRLKRTRIMHIHLGDLGVGQYRVLAGDELGRLTKTVAHSVKTEDASKQQRSRSKSSVVKRKSSGSRGQAGFRPRKR
jgi:23S rRNA pseudouridine2604 synthase